MDINKKVEEINKSLNEDSEFLASRLEAVFENAWNDQRWMGSDASFEECYWVYDIVTNSLWFQRNGDQLWDAWSPSPELIEDLEDIFKVENLRKFCDIYETYNNIGKLTTILSYNSDPFGAYNNLITTEQLKRIIIKRENNV